MYLEQLKNWMFIMILGLTLLLVSCEHKPRSFDYIEWNTEEYIGRDQPIRIRFDSTLQKQFPEINPYTIITVPNFKKKLQWKDPQTLEIIPEEFLISGENYTIKVNPHYLGMDDEDVYEFPITVKSLFAKNENPIIHFQEDQYMIDLAIPFKFSDVLSSQELERATRVVIAGVDQDFQATWETNPNSTRHTLKIPHLHRHQTEMNVLVKLNPNFLDSKQDLNFQFNFPHPDTFQVLRIEPFTQQISGFEVHFSHPPKPMDYNGVVTLDAHNKEYHSESMGSPLGIKYHYELIENVLKVYTDQVLTSEMDLNIYEGIFSSFTDKQLTPITEVVQFERPLPGLRKVASGNILPDAEKLYFPFEAVGLKAVYLEIIEIPSYNLKQFFQFNDLDEDNDLDKVGKKVFEGKLPLYLIDSDSDISNWSRYALDLKKYVSPKKKSLYHIVLSFKPSYVNQLCAVNLSDEFTDNHYYSHSEHHLKTMMDIPYYGFSDYDSYDYLNINNPCFGEYYTSNRFITQNLLSSDIGLLVYKSGSNKVIVRTQAIGDLHPLSSVVVEVYDYQHGLLLSGKTNQEGMVTFQFDNEVRPYLIKAMRGMDVMYQKIDHGNARSMSEFNTTGVVINDGFKGFFYAEREVWRPGDSIYVDFILSNASHAYHMPVNYTVTNPRGKVVTEMKGIHGRNGMYALHFKTSPSSETGMYRLQVSIGNSEFYENISVEPIKPNRLEITYTQPIQVDFTKHTFSLPMHAQWLHGGKVSKFKYQTDVKVFSKPFESINYNHYDFSSELSYLVQEFSMSGDLDGNGSAVLQHKVVDKNKFQGFAQFNLLTRVFEPSGEYSTEKKVEQIFPYSFAVGVKFANITDDDYVLFKEGEKVGFNIIAVDENDSKITDAYIDIKIYKEEWVWWWEHGYSENRVNSNEVQTLVDEVSTNINKLLSGNWAFTPNESGRYFIQICSNEGLCTKKYFYVTAGAYYAKAQFKNPTQLPLSTDKEVYDIGETLQLKMQGEKGQRAFISLESGTKIYKQFIHELVSSEEIINIPLEAEYAPGIYLNVTLLQSRNKLNEDLPLRRYGLKYVKVENKNLKLNPTITTLEVFQPNEKVSITVGEANGRNITYTLAVVDEGLLSLTNFETPNPYDFFMGKETYQNQTWDNYDDIIGPYQKNQRLLSVGGGDALLNNSDVELSRFEAVVEHFGPYVLQEGKSRTHTFTLPNYIGKVRVMVVAREENAYGSRELSVPVKSNLMILATGARRLGMEEMMLMPITIFAKEGKTESVKVSISDVGDNYTFPDGSEWVVQMEGKTQKTIFIPIASTSHLGMAPIRIRATSGSDVSEYQLNMPIVTTSAPINNVEYATIGGKESSKFALPALGIKGTRTTDITISGVVHPRLIQELQRKVNYPYSCTEQITTRGFAALLYLSLLNLESEEEERMKNVVISTLDILKKLQKSEGGWSYWANAQYYDPWLTNYIGHFMYIAQKQGFKLDDQLLSEFKKFQQNLISSWSPSNRNIEGNYNNSDIVQAYRLYTMVLHDAPMTAEMNRLGMLRNLSTGGQIFLAAGYAKLNKPEKIENIKSKSFNVDNSFYDSALRNKAIIAVLQHQIGNTVGAIEQFNELQRLIGNRDWMSTQEVVYASLAVLEMYGSMDGGISVKGSYTLADGIVREFATESSILNIEMNDLKYGSGQSVTIENATDQPFNVCRQIGAESNQIDRVKSKGIIVKNFYFLPNGKEINISEVQSGMDVIVKTRVERTEKLNKAELIEQLALSQVLPSCWQVVSTNVNIDREKNVQYAYAYQDVRDDRVMTYFDMSSQVNAFETALLVNVTYAGEYIVPATIVESMYSPLYYAQTASTKTKVNRF